MAKSDGYLQEFLPEHKTNNLILRWFANDVMHAAAYYFFIRGIRYSLKYEEEFDLDKDFLMPRKDYYLMNLYYKMYSILNKPYDWFGTTYIFDRTLLKVGSDYDWQEDPVTGDAWRLVKAEKQ